MEAARDLICVRHPDSVSADVTTTSLRRLTGKELAASVARQQGSRSERPPLADRLKAIDAKKSNLRADIKADPSLSQSMVLRVAMRDASLRATEMWEALEEIADRAFNRITALETEVAQLRGEQKHETTTAHKGEGERVELELRGEVTRDKCDALIRKINAASPRDEVCLRIVNSNGGDHTASLDLSEALLSHKGQTRVIGEGKVHSAAATILWQGIVMRESQATTQNS